MIDRNCDATLLAGASDLRLANRVLEYARSTREKLGIRSTDFDLGSMLHHDVPFLASIAGAQMQDAEKTTNPHLTGTYSRDRSIAEAARHVLRSNAFVSAMPDNCLLVDPVRGNAAALLVDRVARLAGVSRIDEDGPRDALAAHMASAGVRRGRGMTSEWSPGWPDGEINPLSDVKAYSTRAYVLDDRQLAAEMLDHCRDMRTRLDIRDVDERHAATLWQTVPAIASLFGSHLEIGEAQRFSDMVSGLDDQQTFGVASRMVASTLGFTSLSDHDMTIGERSMFASVETGNTAVLLLDRAARALDAERGGEDDPVGRAILLFRQDRRLPPSHAWEPEDTGRHVRNASMMAGMAPGIGS